TYTPIFYLYPLSLHDALPIWSRAELVDQGYQEAQICRDVAFNGFRSLDDFVDIFGHDLEMDNATAFLCRSCFRSRGELGNITGRSEEHTSELQSRGHLVCRLL